MIVRVQDAHDVCSYIQRIMCDRGIPPLVLNTDYTEARGEQAPEASSFPRMILCQMDRNAIPIHFGPNVGLVRDLAQLLVSIPIPHIQVQMRSTE